MKKLLLILMPIAGTWTAGAAEIHCTACKAKVLLGDKFCPNCGTRTEQSQYWHEVETHESGHALPVPMGMLRGLAEIACSPLELCRGMTTLTCSLWQYSDPGSAFFGTILGVPVVASIMGGASIVADVGMGTLDVVSLGTLGNVFWDGDKTSPYVFDRDWTESPGNGVRGIWF